MRVQRRRRFGVNCAAVAAAVAAAENDGGGE